MRQNFQWKPVSCGRDAKDKPTMRWGHQFAQIGEELVLFGGFGSEEKDSKYLDDLWVYDTLKMTWREVKTKGKKPQKKSNFSMNYAQCINSIVVFGGGSQGRKRSNSINILNWQTKVWSEHIPSINEHSPWQRTYHTAQLVYPYLIVYGGQSISSIDLSDSWVYNLQTKKWRQVSTPEGSVTPGDRRFHASAIIGSKMYIIGGCRGANYTPIGDIYSLDLAPLLQHDSVELKWQFVVKSNKIERWGHTASALNNKIFIFAGRSEQDHNDLLCLSPEERQIIALPVSADSLPKERRRHSAQFIGGCLLVFGGFNGCYLRDFHYIDLSTFQYSFPKSINPERSSIRWVNPADFEKTINRYQGFTAKDLELEIKSNDRILGKIKVNQKKLKNYTYFKNSLRKNATMWLPQSFEYSHFKLLIQYIQTGFLILPLTFSLQELILLWKQSYYFCLMDLSYLIENQLILKLNEDNWETMIEFAIINNLTSLQRKCMEAALEKRNIILQKINQYFHDNLEKSKRSNENPSMGNLFHDQNSLQSQSDSLNKRKLAFLIQAYKIIRFDIIQQHQKKQLIQISIFNRITHKIKNIFNGSEQSDEQKSNKKKQSLIHQICHFLMKLCRNTQVGNSQQITRQ